MLLGSKKKNILVIMKLGIVICSKSPDQTCQWRGGGWLGLGQGGRGCSWWRSCESAFSSSYHDMTTALIALIDTCHTCGGSAGTAGSCVSSGNATVSWPPTVTPASTSGVRGFTLFVATLQHFVTSRPSLLGVSAQIQGVSVPTSTHSHSLDGLAEMSATAASAAVSNVVGTISEPNLSVHVTAMKVQWHVLLPSPHLNPRHPFLLTASTSSISRTRRPSLSLKRTHTSSASKACSRSATAPQGMCSPLQHLRSPETPRRVTRARARIRRARPIDATRIRVRPRGSADNTYDAQCRLAPTATLSFVLTTKLSDPLFGDVLGAP